MRLIAMMMALVGATAWAGPVRVEVDRVEDSRVGALSEPEVREVLGRAGKLILGAGVGEVRWEVSEKVVPVEAFVGEVKKRGELAGRVSLEGLGKVKVEELAGMIEPACKAYGRLEELRALMGVGEVREMGSYGEVARALAGRYQGRLTDLCGRRSERGEVLVSGVAGEAYRLGWWDTGFVMAGEEVGVVHLTLFNGYLVEDSVADAPPHSLVGATAYGLSSVRARRSVVATHLLMMDETLRMKLGEEGNRLDAVAYVVAHEVGLHVLGHMADDYGEGAGIARPLATLKEVGALRPARVGAPTGKMLKMEYLAVSDLEVEMRVRLAKGDGEGFAKAAEMLQGLKVPQEVKDGVLARVVGEKDPAPAK